MRLYYDSTNKEVCNDFYFENSLVGSMANFLSGTPSMVNIVAVERTELLLIGFKDAIDLVTKYKTLNKFAFTLLQEELQRAERRAAELLKFAPEDRFKNLMDVHPKIFKRVPLQYIASYLAITPETLSRYRAKYNS